MRGVMILTPATLLAKIIGLFYKIPLLLIVGVEGMAYFLSAYHVYSLLFVLSAAGLPSALSLLVSRHVASGSKGAVGRIFGVSLAVFLLFGCVGTATLCLFAKEIAAGLSMREAAFSLMAIAPALMLSAFTGAVRGLFQGHHNMVPTAVSEVIEAVGKLLFGITLAYFAKSRGVSVAGVAAAAVFGITLGVLLSALYLALCLFAARKTLFSSPLGAMPSRWALLREILRVAFPVTVSASVMSLVSLVDTALISSRLQAGGFAPGIANAMYSSYGNLAVPLYNLVPALLAPITLSLTPTLTAAFAAGDEEGVRDAFSGALRLTSLIALPAALGLSVFSRPILSLLYAGQDAAVAVAAPLLSVLAPAIFPAVLIALTSAALQAANKASVPVWSSFTGAVVKLLLQAPLLTCADINIMGAPISTLACNVTVLAINMAVLSRTVSLRTLPIGTLMRPLAAALLAVLGGGIGYFGLLRYFGQRSWQMPLVLLFVVLFYGLLALHLGALDVEDIKELPCGSAICRVLEKCNVLREVKKRDKRRKITVDLRKKRI